jgi:hypothetical protein
MLYSSSSVRATSTWPATNSKVAGRAAEVLGHEPEKPQRAQLHSEPKTACGAALGEDELSVGV